MMIVVVPGDEVVAPPASVVHVAKTPWVVGLIFQRVKVRLLVRVVVRDARPRVAAVDTERREQVGEAVRGHRGTAVLVNDELARLDAVACDGFGEELLSQRTVLSLCDPSRQRRSD